MPAAAYHELSGLIEGGSSMTAAAAQIRADFPGTTVRAARDWASYAQTQFQRREAISNANPGQFASIASLFGCPDFRGQARIRVEITVIDPATGSPRAFGATVYQSGTFRIRDLLRNAAGEALTLAMQGAYQVEGEDFEPADFGNTYRFTDIECL